VTVFLIIFTFCNQETDIYLKLIKHDNYLILLFLIVRYYWIWFNKNIYEQIITLTKLN